MLYPPRLQTEESRLVGTPCLETTLRHPWAGTPWPPWCPAPGGQVQSSRRACCPQRHSRYVLPWVPTAWTGEEVWVSIAPPGCTSRVGHSSATAPSDFRQSSSLWPWLWAHIWATPATEMWLAACTHRSAPLGMRSPKGGSLGLTWWVRQAKSHQTQGVMPTARGPTVPLSWGHWYLLPGSMALCWGGSLLQGPREKAGYQGSSAWSGCKKLLSTQWGFSPSGLLILRGPRVLGIGGVWGAGPGT